MRLLLVNPNTSAGVTERIAAAARLYAHRDTEIVALTAPRGVPYIATRAEAAIGSHVALEMLAEHIGGFDAAVIAAFGDPGLGGAREMAAVPVVGLAEAAMHSACLLGTRFSIVSFARALGPWYRECVAYCGLEHRLASLRLLEGDFASIADVQEEKEALLVELAGRAVHEDGADVVILAGAPLAGLAPNVAERIPVPVVDGVGAAVTQAQGLAALRPRKARAGTFRRPDAKSSSGLAPALADWLAGRG